MKAAEIFLCRFCFLFLEKKEAGDCGRPCPFVPYGEDGVYFCVTKSTKSQKEERINSCLGDADTHAARMCQFLF